MHQTHDGNVFAGYPNRHNSAIRSGPPETQEQKQKDEK